MNYNKAFKLFCKQVLDIESKGLSQIQIKNIKNTFIYKQFIFALYFENLKLTIIKEMGKFFK